MCLSKATGEFGRLSVVNPISGELLKWQRCTAKREIVVGECSFTEYFRSNDSSIGNWGKKVTYTVFSTEKKKKKSARVTINSKEKISFNSDFKPTTT